MKEIRKNHDVVWIDLESPTLDEIREVINEYNISPLIGNELLNPSLRSRVDLYKKYMYVILQFPTIASDGSIIETEVDFVIGKNFIITTRYEHVDSLYEFSKAFEADTILDKQHMGDHSGFVFYYMLRNFYKSIIHQLELIKDNLRKIEREIFSNKEKEMVLKISQASRQLLNITSGLDMHKEILMSFEKNSEKIFDTDFNYFARNITNEYLRIDSVLKELKNYTFELRDTNTSLLSTKQNETMKQLTLMTFIMFPASVIAAIFSTNAKNVPILGHENDFAIIFSIILFVTVTLYIFLRSKKI